MKNLIEEWEQLAQQYQSLSRKAVSSVNQEGLLCRSEVYSYCADKLRRRLQPAVQADARRCLQVSDKCRYSEHSKHCTECHHYGTA